jgi:hypothetical protein
MSEAIEGARRVIETRLSEIEAEATGLRDALRSLGGGAAGRPGRPKPSIAARAKAGARKRRRRAPRGQRQKEVLEAARKAPGSTAADLGRAIGISTNQAYALCKRMLKSGELKKKGKGYAAAASKA